MKIIYALRSVTHFVTHDSTVRELCNRGHDVTVLFDKGWSEGEADHAIEKCVAENERLQRGWSLRRDDSWRLPLFLIREVLAFLSYKNRSDQSIFYLNRWGKYIDHRARRLIESRLTSFIFNNPFSRWAMECLEYLCPPDPKIKRWLQQEQPDVLVASPSNHRYSEEVEYVKAAKSLGIPTVVPVLSWDNLTTKGLTHVVPDVMLVWNKSQGAEAINIHGIPALNILEVGASGLDKWFKTTNMTMSKKDFWSKAGLQDGSDYILYLGSSGNIAGNETWLILELAEKMRVHSNPIIQKMQILARPHPANRKHYYSLDDAEGIVFWPKKWALPDNDEDLQDFHNSLYHATGVIGINTTAMIDSVLFDKPTGSIVVDQYKNTQTKAVHFKYLMEAHALELAYGVDDGIRMIEEMTQGVDRLQGNRRSFVLNFLRPCGLNKPVAKVSATAIELMGDGKTALEVRRIIN